jgi:hypothetical protein
MKVTLELKGTELVLLYLMTGNEEAGRIVCDAAREYSKNQPKKVRSRAYRGRTVLSPCWCSSMWER